MARSTTTLRYAALACLLLAGRGVAAEEGDAAPPPGDPAPAPAPGPSALSPFAASKPAEVPPSAATRPSSSPERSPAMLHLMVGAMGGSADFGLSFDVGMEVHRWFATYSAWSAFYGDGRVTFSGAKAGYVHPIHRVWALYGAAGGGQLHYRAPADLAPEFTADGGAITVEGGFMLDPLPLSSGFRFGVMAVIPVFTPGMPPGQEVEAPALMASVSINPVILALGLLGGKL